MAQEIKYIQEGAISEEFFSDEGTENYLKLVHEAEQIKNKMNNAKIQVIITVSWEKYAASFFKEDKLVLSIEYGFEGKYWYGARINYDFLKMHENLEYWFYKAGEAKKQGNSWEEVISWVHDYMDFSRL
ncbi:MAG: hypothetical protein QXV17_06500 [Candidatus Micrarchaeaceae archaeon]